LKRLNCKYEAEIENASIDAQHNTHKLILDHHGKMVGHAVSHHKNENDHQIKQNSAKTSD
jgi:hypothetical protein